MKHDKAVAIKLLLLDVDGILSDGKIYYDNAGNEFKSFHASDGIGIKLLIASGVNVGIITGRSSEIVNRRAKELGINIVQQGIKDKLSAIQHIVDTENLAPQQIAYMGDDLPDISAIKFAGFGITAPNAQELIKHHVDYVTETPGGYGAVREACELIMQSQGTFDDAIKRFLGET